VSDIFREIDEELRRDNLLKLWQRYGIYILGVAVLIVAATGGYVAWQRYEEGRRQDQSRAYEGGLMLARSDPKAAIEAMQRLGGGGEPYAMLARFQEAGLKAKQGDTAGALAAYDALSKDTDNAQTFRDAATILYATHALDSEDPNALIERLKPLTAPTSPWRHSALELTGLAAQRAGDTARARDIFTALAADSEAPQDLRSRAAEILAALQG
jgi:hypothetical protein